MKDEERTLMRTLTKVMLGGLSFAGGGGIATGLGAFMWAVQKDNPEYNDATGAFFVIFFLIGATLMLPFGCVAGWLYARFGWWRRGLIGTVVMSLLLGVLAYANGTDSQGGGIAPLWIPIGVFGGVVAAALFRSLVVRGNQQRQPSSAGRARAQQLQPPKA